MQRLQEVRFALGILAVQYVEARLQIHSEFVVVSEALKADLAYAGGSLVFGFRPHRCIQKEVLEREVTSILMESSAVENPSRNLPISPPRAAFEPRGGKRTSRHGVENRVQNTPLRTSLGADFSHTATIAPGFHSASTGYSGGFQDAGAGEDGPGWLLEMESTAQITPAADVGTCSRMMKGDPDQWITA